MEKTKDGLQDRLLTLAAIYDGATRAQAAKIGDVGLQSIGDWVLRFNGRGPEGPLPPDWNVTSSKSRPRETNWQRSFLRRSSPSLSTF